MPIIASRGAMSSTGFGEFSQKKAQPVKYIVQSNSNQLFGKTANTISAGTWTLLNPQPPFVNVTLISTSTPPGVFQNDFGISTYFHQSQYNGAWSALSRGDGLPTNPAYSTNGGMAYNPTTKVMAFPWRDTTKGAVSYLGLTLVNTISNSHTVPALALIGGGFYGSTNSIVYASALDSFYVYVNNQVFRFNGTTGAFISNGGIGTLNNILDVTVDGYLLVDVGTTIRKYTSADLSTFENVGTPNQSGRGGTRVFYNGNYYRLIGAVGSSTLGLYSWSGSGSEVFISSVSVSPIQSIFRYQLEHDGSEFIVFVGGSYQGKGVEYVGIMRTTNNTVDWSSVSLPFSSTFGFGFLK